MVACRIFDLETAHFAEAVLADFVRSSTAFTETHFLGDAGGEHLERRSAFLAKVAVRFGNCVALGAIHAD